MDEKESQQDIKITKLETCYEFMTEKLIAIEKMVSLFDEKLDRALEKKANKWVEKFVAGFIIAILSGLFGYVGTLIYKTIIHLG